MNKKLNEILKEIGVYFIFLAILYYVSFTNLSNSAFTYNQLFKYTFLDSQNLNEIGLNDVVFILNFFLLVKLSLTFIFNY